MEYNDNDHNMNSNFDDQMKEKEGEVDALVTDLQGVEMDNVHVASALTQGNTTVGSRRGSKSSSQVDQQNSGTENSAGFETVNDGSSSSSGVELAAGTLEEGNSEMNDAGKTHSRGGGSRGLQGDGAAVAAGDQEAGEGGGGGAAAARRRAARAVDAMLVELNRQFMPQGVQVLDVIITRVLLPPEIQQQMSNKTFIISENAQQRMNQKWEMQRLEHEEEMTTLRQEQVEEQMEESSKGTHSVQLLQKELDVKGADMQRAKKKVLEDGHIKAQMVVAEAEAQAAKLRVEADNILAILKAESQKVAAVSQSETTKFVETRLGEAALQAAKNHAKAAEILNDGEEKVSEMLEAKREHELRELRVGVYHALAGNEKTIITDGADASKANHMLITEAILAGDGGGGGFAGSGAAGG
eukprot:CAMPEP_0194719624 /NCGR_PEP_ID=MMETSP0296-20130528/11038_1 /TAXON_ID=39354 /ORGANISM="Heterosigma akashiwo, Strain CCMP2393" /LENGTH=411 /DNA_ID=CAMNT_0039621429 /DNA_START=43 /DNA_END=1273 /DNA_ORIENTATION=-